MLGVEGPVGVVGAGLLPLGDVLRGAEQQVHVGHRSARCWVEPKGWSAPASRASVLVTPVKSSRPRSSPCTTLGDSPAGWAPSAGYTAQETMISLVPAAIAAANGTSSTERSVFSDRLSVTGPASVFWLAAALGS